MCGEAKGLLRKNAVYLLLYVFGGTKNFALLDFPSQTVERMNRAFYIH
jgi:hypothetical protein